MRTPLILKQRYVCPNVRRNVNAEARNQNRAAEGLGFAKSKGTAQDFGDELLALARRLLIVTLGLGAALGIAAIFDVDA